MKIYHNAIIIGVAVTISSSIGIIAFEDGVTWHTLEFYKRMIGRSSVPWFLLSFSASTMYHYFPSILTKYVFKHRKYIGIGFAIVISHHLLGILLELFKYNTKFLNILTLEELILGFMAFVFAIGMGLTSSTGAIKWMTPKAWSYVQTVGGYYLLLMLWMTYFDHDLKDLHIFLWINGVLILRMIRRLQMLNSKRAKMKLIGETALEGGQPT